MTGPNFVHAEARPRMGAQGANLDEAVGSDNGGGGNVGGPDLDLAELARGRNKKRLGGPEPTWPKGCIGAGPLGRFPREVRRRRHG